MFKPHLSLSPIVVIMPNKVHQNITNSECHNGSVVKHVLVVDMVATESCIQIPRLLKSNFCHYVKTKCPKTSSHCESHNGSVVKHMLIVNKVVMELWVQISLLLKSNCCHYV